jgi:HPt (histidine-containing phosphotransfer) domain-containing protein
MEASLLQRIDLLALTINLSGDKHAIRELLELFLHANTQTLKRLEEAKENDNIIAWLQLAHQMKGSAGYIGARRLTGLCVEAEDIKKLPSEQSAAVLYHMGKELSHLRETISRHLSTF